MMRTSASVVGVLLSSGLVFSLVGQDYVTSIEFSQKTSNLQWANSHDSFSLQIGRGPSNSSTYCTIDFPTPQAFERQKRSFDTHLLSVDPTAAVRGQLVLVELPPNRVSL